MPDNSENLTGNLDALADNSGECIENQRDWQILGVVWWLCTISREVL